MKNLAETKKNWEKLYAKASAQFEYEGSYTGKPTPPELMDFARQNADDTCGWDANTKRYWQIAFGSIQCSAEAHGVMDEVAPWFTANGWRF
jgi:hypothetical protein